MPDDAPDPHRPFSLAETLVVIVDALLGLGLCAFALMLLGDGPSGETHSGAWLGKALAQLSGPAGLLFLLAAVAVARRWPGRAWYHLLPLMWVPLMGARL